MRNDELTKNELHGLDHQRYKFGGDNVNLLKHLEDVCSESEINDTSDEVFGRLHLVAVELKLRPKHVKNVVSRGRVIEEHSNVVQDEEHGSEVVVNHEIL